MNHDRIISVSVKLEAGYDMAMLGLSFNKNQPADRMHRVATHLAPKDYGHNKFLRQIWLWIDVRAPRYWWQEADTYTVATSKQSESTVHTGLKRTLTAQDFCEGRVTFETLNKLNDYIMKKDFRGLKQYLPESFMQRRMWNINYATLRNITVQRHDHALVEWQIFLYNVLQQIEHPEWVPGDVTKLQETIARKIGVKNG